MSGGTERNAISGGAGCLAAKPGRALAAVFDEPGARFVLLPAGKKFPPLEKEWQDKPHSFREAAAHMGNVGIMAGNGFVGLDQDVPEAFQGLALSDTTAWETRPGRLGMWFRCDDRTPELLKKYGKKADLSQFKLHKNGQPIGEIKLERSYQVIPPSWKTLEDGQRADYKLLSEVSPAEISLEWLLDELLKIGITFSSRLDQNAARLEDLTRQKKQARAMTDEQRARRYAEAALEDEIKILASTSEGNRNSQLNKSAFALGQFVAAGVLSESEVISALAAVAEDGEPEKIPATIRSGLDAGARRPRAIPERAGEKEGLVWGDLMADKGDEEKPKWVFSPTLAARNVLNKMELAMSEDSDSIYRFNGQIWKPDGSRKIDMAFCDVAGDHVTNHTLKETLRRIENYLKDKPVQFEPDPYLLPVKNGVANLLTGEIREYRPEDLLLDQLEVTYDPGARCPTFLKFLESSAPNISDRITLIDWFVATAIKEPLPYALFLLGLGRNGKGLYERLLKRFFGGHNFRDMDLEEVAKNNFAQSAFFRVRGWIASETGKKRKPVIGTDFVKMTSGNGVIDADRKNRERIRFEPYFQTIVDTNLMPKIEDNSVGWIERFIKVDLPYVFVANPDPKNPLEKLRDPGLFEKMTTASELSGILNLLLYRSKAIGKARTIHKRPGSEMFAEYAQQSSSVSTFAELFLEYHYDMPKVQIPTKTIYEAYKEWCGYKVGEVVEDSYFGRYLKRLCNGIDPKRPKINGKDVTVYPGLNFKESAFKAAIEELKKSRGIAISDAFVSSSEANSKQSKEERGLQISFSEASEAKLWNELIQLFGEPVRLACDHQGNPGHRPGELQGEDSSNLPPKPPLPPKTATADPVENSPASEMLTNLPPKAASGGAKDVNAGVPPKASSGIEAELVEARARAAEKEEHDRTPRPPAIRCAKCGRNLAGQGTITKNGVTYCTQPGCGYPQRGGES